ncbi:hypothetical protein QL285_021031 [Trifolium repens]|nr:hypothetical protein QL285_021031 [Trifolium repens]
MQKILLRVWSSYATNSAFWRVSEVLLMQLKCQLQVDRLSGARTRMGLTVGAELGLSNQKFIFSSLLLLSVVLVALSAVFLC